MTTPLFTVPAALKTAGAASSIVKTTVVNVTAAQMTATALNALVGSNTTLQLPAGTFNLDAVIFIGGVSNLVLQGASGPSGENLTTLNFTKSLTELYGNNTIAYGQYGAWHGGGGFISVGKKHPLYSNGGNSPSSYVTIQNLHITFARTAYLSIQQGWNAIWAYFAEDCLFRNISVTNFDNAVVMTHCSYVTASGFNLNSVRSAHIGAGIVQSTYCLVEDVVSSFQVNHQIAVQQCSYCVVQNCSSVKGAGDALSFRGGTSNNLFMNLACQELILGVSNGQNKDLATTFGKTEFFWNCLNYGAAFSAVPAFLVGTIEIYSGPVAAPQFV